PGLHRSASIAPYRSSDRRRAIAWSSIPPEKMTGGLNATRPTRSHPSTHVHAQRWPRSLGEIGDRRPGILRLHAQSPLGENHALLAVSGFRHHLGLEVTQVGNACVFGIADIDDGDRHEPIGNG